MNGAGSGDVVVAIVKSGESIATVEPKGGQA
jgi:hypothetical protein